MDYIDIAEERINEQNTELRICPKTQHRDLKNIKYIKNHEKLSGKSNIHLLGFLEVESKYC